MPPLFMLKIAVNQSKLEDLKALPTRARSNLRSALRTDLAPALEAEINRIMPTLDPPNAEHPFEFGSVLNGIDGYSAKNPSRRKYFAMVAAGEVPSDGSAYSRTGDIETSFEVEIAGQFIENLIRVFNRHTKARFLYGPHQVAGHRNTGWGVRLEEAKAIFQKSTRIRVAALWRKSVAAAAKGRSL